MARDETLRSSKDVQKGLFVSAGDLFHFLATSRRTATIRLTTKGTATWRSGSPANGSGSKSRGSAQIRWRTGRSVVAEGNAYLKLSATGTVRRTTANRENRRPRFVHHARALLRDQVLRFSIKGHRRHRAAP